VVTLTATGTAVRTATVDALPRPTLGILADALNRRRLQSALESNGFAVVAAAGSVQALLDSALTPMDVAVVLGGPDTLSRCGTVELMCNLRPSLPIVLVCQTVERAFVRKALRAGVDGVVGYADDMAVLGSTISAVLAGQITVPQSIRKTVAWGALSLREKQVLELVAEGLTNGEIANRLFLSESTIKSHLSSSFRKLSVSSRAEAAATVLDPEHGLRVHLARAAAPALDQLEQQLLVVS